MVRLLSGVGCARPRIPIINAMLPFLWELFLFPKDKRIKNIIVMGTSNWETHEKECFEYLVKKFGQCAEFEFFGGSDSTISDIKVKQKNGNSFWIECKSPHAQSGQFVVTPINGHFEFSKKNRSMQNEVTEFIIAIMNRDFNKYNNSGTTGINLNIDSEIYAKWIKSMYAKKGVQYFITHAQSGKFVMLNIEDLSKYYAITAKFRVKKSGSSNVAKSRQEALAEQIVKLMNYSECQIQFGVKMKVNSLGIFDKQTIEVDGVTYMFSSVGDGEYVVRKLSNTNNLNVIFSISLKNENGISEDTFKEKLLK